MPNELNKVLDGALSASSSVAQSLLTKNHRHNAEKAFSDLKRKLITSYSLFAKAQEHAPEALQALKTARITGNADTPNSMQPPPTADEAQVIPFEPLTTYGHLLDFKSNLNKNPLSNRYKADADNLFSLLFGSDFIKKNITEKKFTPAELQNMSFDAAKALNKRQMVDNIMLLSDDVRNKLMESNEFARKVYQKKSGMKRAIPVNHHL